MKKKFIFCYEKITPESARKADVAERGFYDPETGVHLDISKLDIAETIKQKEQFKIDTRTALNRAVCLGICMSDSPYSFTTVDPVRNIFTASETFYSLHIEENDITRSTYKRISRILGADDKRKALFGHKEPEKA